MKNSFTNGFIDCVIFVVLKLINNPCGLSNNFMYVKICAWWIGKRFSTDFNSTTIQSLTNKSILKSDSKKSKKTSDITQQP